MRSGKGKCPQCKEIIIVDLDAPEIRCPYCNALLKKSNRNPADVRREEEAVAAEKAREQAAAAEMARIQAEREAEEEAIRRAEEEAKRAAEEEARRKAEEEAKRAAEEEARKAAEEEARRKAEEEAKAKEEAERAAEAMKRELEEMQRKQEEEIRRAAEEAKRKVEEELRFAAEEEQAPAEEVASTVDEEPDYSDSFVTDSDIPAAPAAEEPVDEIGISDEELAAMDAPTDAVAPAEEAPAEEPAPNPEELAAAMAADLSFLSSFADEANGAEPEAVAEDAPAVEEKAVAAEPEAEEVAATEDATVEPETEALPEKETIDEVVPEEPVAEEGPVVAPAEEPVGEKSPASDVVADEVAAFAEDAPAEDAPAAVEKPAEPESEPVSEEDAIVSQSNIAALLMDDEPVAPAPEPEKALYSQEDMELAASLDADEGYLTPGAESPKTTRSGKVGFKKYGKDAAPEKKEEEKGESKAIYNKGVAITMIILTILTLGIYLLYYQVFVSKNSVIEMVSKDLYEKLIDVLPTFGSAEMFPIYVTAIMFGLIAVISILGMTGKKGTVGFVFVLLADIVFALTKAWSLHEGMFFLDNDTIFKLVQEFEKTYISYGVYGLLLIGAIAFAVSFGSGKEDFGFSGATAILPIVYFLLTALGYVAMVLLPVLVDGMPDFGEYTKIVILAMIGIPVLLTLIGVHSKTASRSANGWLLFGILMATVLLFAANTVLGELANKLIKDAADHPAEVAEALLQDIPDYVTPMYALIAVLGLSIADLRN